MNQSETTAALFAALAKAQAEFPAIPKDKRATIETKTGAGFSYSYADLATILDAIRPVLGKYGLSVVQSTRLTEPGWVQKSTQINHESGEWLETLSVPVPMGSDARAMGSADTYARRYGLTSALAIATEEDDDAGQVSTPKRTVQTPQTPTEPGDYIMPLGKYKGKKLSEIPSGYLREYILGDTFDKKDIREAVQAYLNTVVSDGDVAYLIRLAEAAGPMVSVEKVKAQLAAQGHHVSRSWYESALRAMRKLCGENWENVVAQASAEGDFAAEAEKAAEAPDATQALENFLEERASI